MLGVVAPVCTQPNITFYGGRKQASTKFSFSLSEHGYVCLEFGSMRVRLHLTKQASLGDVFRGRRRRGILNSLLSRSSVALD